MAAYGHTLFFFFARGMSVIPTPSSDAWERRLQNVGPGQAAGDSCMGPVLIS
jgi:hypothetical protein